MHALHDMSGACTSCVLYQHAVLSLVVADFPATDQPSTSSSSRHGDCAPHHAPLLRSQRCHAAALPVGWALLCSAGTHLPQTERLAHLLHLLLLALGNSMRFIAQPAQQPARTHVAAGVNNGVTLLTGKPAPGFQSCVQLQCASRSHNFVVAAWLHCCCSCESWARHEQTQGAMLLCCIYAHPPQQKGSNAAAAAAALPDKRTFVHMHHVLGPWTGSALLTEMHHTRASLAAHHGCRCCAVDEKHPL